jgi:hypothetical protein
MSPEVKHTGRIRDDNKKFSVITLSGGCPCVL